MAEAERIAALFRDVLPEDARRTGDACHALAADGLSPGLVLLPATLDELSRCLSIADEAGLAALPVGGGTNLSLGAIPERYDVALSTRRLNRVVAHEAADMTITVQAGTTLAEANAVLGDAGQRLPLDPPLATQATVGGIIATDGNGPLRLMHGKVRDLLIGVTAVLADGRVVHGGGRVVKNVAGYDLMKLFTGSYGTLGVVAEATFKVRPRPESLIVGVVPAATVQEGAALGIELCGTHLLPSFVEAVTPSLAGSFGVHGKAACVVGFEGTRAETRAQTERLQERIGRSSGLLLIDEEASEDPLRTLRDFPAVDSQEDAVVGCKVRVLPTRLPDVLSNVCADAPRQGLDVSALVHVGSGVAGLRVRGTEGSDSGLAAFLLHARLTAEKFGGWAVFDRLPTRMKKTLDPWGTEPPGISLMRGVKAALDPRGVFTPGRFVGGI